MPLIRRRRKGIATGDGRVIPFAAVVAVLSIDERSRPAAGLYPGQTQTPPLHYGGAAVVYKQADGSIARAVVAGTVPELLARIAAGKG